MTFRTGFSFLFSCVFSSFLFAQTQIHIRNGCHYDDDQLAQDIYAYEPSSEAQQIVSQIAAVMGLEQNFTIKAASVKNALATTEGRQRYILYSTAFLENFKRDSRLRWAAYGVLAHEIGHHLNYHDFDEHDPKRRRAMEVRADYFSGNILQKLGATLDEAQACISQFSLDGESDTHPSKTVRLDAVANGWKQAQRNINLDYSSDNDSIDCKAGNWGNFCFRNETDRKIEIEIPNTKHTLTLKVNESKCFTSLKSGAYFAVISKFNDNDKDTQLSHYMDRGFRVNQCIIVPEPFTISSIVFLEQNRSPRQTERLTPQYLTAFINSCGFQSR